MMDAVTYQKITSIISMSSVPFMFTLAGDFVFDDSEAIVKNNDVISDSWSEPFYHDFWGANITNPHSHKSYRPLTILSFRLNYLFNDNQLSATQLKVTNLICHTICCLLIWQAIERIMNRVKYRLRVEYSIDLAYSTALLFSSHPVHTEAVCGIVGRADLLGAMTFFLSFLAYEKSMDNTGLKILYIVAAVVLAGCSMLCKENGITVLGFCIVYEFIVHCKISRSRLFHLCKKSILRIVCMMVAAACLLYLRWTIMGGTTPVFKPTDNPAAFSDDFFVKIATYNYIYFINLLLFVWPQWLCYDWSMGCIPLIKSIDDYRIIWIALMYGFGILFLFGIFHSNKRNSTKRMLLTAVALVIVPFLPATNILYPVGFVVAERILYISSVGYCLIICISFNKIVQVDKYRMYGLLFFCLTLVIYDARTWKRSKDWQNEHQLLHPQYYQALNNLANLLKNDNKFAEAEMYLKSAIRYKEDFPAAWMNLGIVYAHTKRYDKALKAYNTALSYRSNYPDCHYNIGNMYLELNKTDDAMKHWYKAISLKSTHAPAWTNLIALLDNTGQREKALQIIPNALKELPNSASINFILANIYGKMDKYEEAEKYFLNAITLFGKRVQSVHFSNLGVLYHRWKKYDLAEQMYRKALKLDPNSSSIMKNLSKIQKLRQKIPKEN